MTEATDALTKLYEAFAAGDGDALGALLGDCHWVEAAGGPYGGTYRGLGEVAENVFGPIGRDIQDFSAVPDEIQPLGDNRAIALGIYRGTTSAGPLAIRFAHIATVEGGRIAHFEQMTDTHEWRAAVGR
jgi:ketosteroid isomerase-like protein